ncbi:MAG TPA: indole-3-glycerol phosphate synthase TrpC [Candidatus Omnitrophica bacterium]|nr:indole-3-glycerol phosphate synthase TrpC [Candidatus Omnitrophota bacterium]
MNILAKIIKEKKKVIERSKEKVSFESLLRKLKHAPKGRLFKKALKKRKRPTLIAEIKKASPSKGIIRKSFNPVKIAKIYEKSGVDCISVLTDEQFFKGRLDYIKDIKKRVRLPILRKDFIIDEYQIYESRANGADAILLISSILPIEKLKKFLKIAKKIKLDCLVECDCLSSLRKALKADAEIIGINNRDLHNFKVDLKRTKRLIKYIPKGKIVVSESGINTRDDIEFLKTLGVSSVLIGTSFMICKDIAGKVKELF